MAVRLRKKLLIALLAPLLFLGLVEGSFRLFDVQPPGADRPPVIFVGNEFESSPVVWDDDVFWRMKPGAEGRVAWEDGINEEGFRGPLRAVPKPKGVRRVLLLGDSCTHGTHARLDATFGARLERWLGTHDASAWEIINAGTPGFSVFQMSRMFDVTVDDHRPDVVVLYPGAWNDYVPAMGGDDETLYERMRSARSGLNRLRMVQVLRGWARPPPDAEEARRERKEYRKRWSRADAGPHGPRVPKASFRRLLDGLVTKVKANGAHVVLMVPPAPLRTRERWPVSGEYAQMVRDVARARGADLIDLPGVFGRSGITEERLFSDVIHPADAGHQLIFEALANHWVQKGLPDAPTSVPDLTPRPLTDFTIAEVLVGDPLTPTRDLEVPMHDGRAAFPSPHVIRMAPIEIPRHCSLVFALRASSDAQGRGAGEAHFEVWIDDGAEETQVLSERVPTHPQRVGWSDAHPARVDLADYGDRRVGIRLVARGPVHLVTWGRAAIHPFR